MIHVRININKSYVLKHGDGITRTINTAAIRSRLVVIETLQTLLTTRSSSVSLTLLRDRYIITVQHHHPSHTLTKHYSTTPPPLTHTHQALQYNTTTPHTHSPSTSVQHHHPSHTLTKHYSTTPPPLTHTHQALQYNTTTPHTHSPNTLQCQLHTVPLDRCTHMPHTPHSGQRGKTRPHTPHMTPPYRGRGNYRPPAENRGQRQDGGCSWRIGPNSCIMYSHCRRMQSSQGDIGST